MVEGGHVWRPMKNILRFMVDENGGGMGKTGIEASVQSSLRGNLLLYSVCKEEYRSCATWKKSLDLELGPLQ